MQLTNGTAVYSGPEDLHGLRQFSVLRLLFSYTLPAHSAMLVGEGFDHAPLDTLILAVPISWEGTLQQYAGPLHRDCAGKTDVLIRDYAEIDHPQLARMWEKRQRGWGRRLASFR